MISKSQSFRGFIAFRDEVNPLSGSDTGNFVAFDRLNSSAEKLYKICTVDDKSVAHITPQGYKRFIGLTLDAIKCKEVVRCSTWEGCEDFFECEIEACF